MLQRKGMLVNKCLEKKELLIICYREKGMLIIMLQRKGNVNNYVIEKREC